MRSQWKRSEKFDTGSHHFERIWKARLHIRDIIPSELVQSSEAKALLFCSKFSCELKNSVRAVKPELKRIGKEEWLSLTCLKRTKKIAKEVVRTATSGWDSCQKNSKMCMCATSISQTVSKLNTNLSLWLERQERGHWRKMLSDNFSMEGPCKGMYCKRTVHHKERKEVAISYTFHF